MVEVGNWLALFGLLIVLKAGLLLTWGLFRRKVNVEEFKYGWTVITGATDGIGKGLAVELHRRGFNLILISRNPGKLDQVKEELMQQSADAQVVCLPVDFSTCHHDPIPFFQSIEEKLRPYEVSVLINNVGVMYLGPIHKMAWKEVEEMTAINVYPQTFLTRMMLPGMTARYEATKQRSLIINLSSTAAILPMPMMSLYGATKAFNDWLSRALSYECEPAVQIVSFRPGVVNTNLPKAANVKGSGPGVIETEAFAKAAMNCLNQRTCSPHWVHGTMAWAMENIAWPEFMIPVVFWGWKKFSTDWDQGFKKRD